MKAYSYQRILAYFLDIIILSILLFALTFWIPTTEKYEQAVKDEEKIMENYRNNEITEDQMLDKYFDIKYTIDKETMITSFISAILALGYFGTFAYMNNGQTIGKKFMHIKVKGKDKELTHFDFLLRSLIINDVLCSLITITLLFFINSSSYSYTVFAFQSIQSIIVIISFIMIIAKKDKRGLHDLICKTEVVMEK